MSLTDGKAPRAWPASLHLVLFAAIIAVPLLALLGAMFYRSAVQEHQRLERLIGQELDELTASIDRDIERRTAVLQTLASAPALASEDWAAFYLQAKASLGKNYLVLIDAAAGRQLVNTFMPHGEAPAFTGDVATIENMRRTMRPVVSDLFTSQVVKRPVYNISIPISGDGGLRYVMSLGLLPEELLGLLQDQHLEAGWKTEIWDRKGAILAAFARAGALARQDGAGPLARAAARPARRGPEPRRRAHAGGFAPAVTGRLDGARLLSRAAGRCPGPRAVVGVGSGGGAGDAADRRYRLCVRRELHATARGDGTRGGGRRTRRSGRVERHAHRRGERRQRGAARGRAGAREEPHRVALQRTAARHRGRRRAVRRPPVRRRP